MRQVVGIDFSGNHAMWSPGCRRTNVWVASGALKGPDAVVESLRPVQDLSSLQHPFAALANFLNGLEEGYVGIDAPFSLPAEFISRGVQLAWQEVAILTPLDRPFPRGGQLVGAIAPNLPSRGAKVFRETEKYWIRKGVNVRSTTWAGPRGGAPFAAACMNSFGRTSGIRVAADRWPGRSDRRGISGGAASSLGTALHSIQWSGTPSPNEQAIYPDWYGGTRLVNRPAG